MDTVSFKEFIPLGELNNIKEDKNRSVINKLLKKSTTRSGESMLGKFPRNGPFSTEIIHVSIAKIIEDTTYFHDKF